MTSSSRPPIRTERRGHLLEVTIDRPEVLNALDGAAHAGLDRIWTDFEADGDLWVAILTATGDRAFCAGNDMKATAGGAKLRAPASGFGGLTNRPDREKPVIAAVNGLAMGGGLEMVLACDLAVAVDTARFALPEVGVGLYAAAGGVERLTRHVGRKAALELILTGRHVAADEALALGIVNRLVTAGGALDAARLLAERIVANSPTAIRASKRALNRFDRSGEIAPNRDILDDLMRTEDFAEGVSAFAAKRKPVWRNR